MKKNGFTLIELLAIIVILAIIAVITVPIILNIIENSKKGAITDSAYGYRDSINKYYVSNLHNDPHNVFNGVYTINSDGNLEQNGETYIIQVLGQKPNNGYLEYSNNAVKNGCIGIDGYKVIIGNGITETAIKGEC